MLTPFRLIPTRIDRSRFLPAILIPLVEAAEAGADLAPIVKQTAERLGFDSFMYATASYHLKPNNDERMYVFTTLPIDWVQRYDQRAYVECDPRVLYSFESALPLVWDQHSERGKNTKSDIFLDDALAHGVGSGVAFPVYAGYPARNIVALNSAMPVIDAERRVEIAHDLGQMVLFGQCFHEIFVKGAIANGVAPRSQGAPPSPRERECLQMAANGLTSADIALKLGITERTVTFHFANIISKLGVLNRQEAIATAVAQGIIRVTVAR